jgi:hypothetical protein
MKKMFLVLAATACAFVLWGQGTLQLTPGASIRSSGGAYLVLDNMHILNDGSFKQAAGNGFVKLTGGSNVTLSGTGITIIDELLLAKTGTAALGLQSNLTVVSKVNFSGGMLILNNSVLDLGTTGIFTGESETSRAFTAGSGYIQVAGTLNGPSSANLGNLGAMITSPANLGVTTIRRGHAIQTGVSGSNNSIRRYFDIIPTNNQNLKATLRFFYFDAELNGIPEATLNQYKSKDNVNWNLVGADSRSTAANYVEKKSINFFARWTLATATAPTITCPANITTNATMSGCKASVSFAATATGIPAPTITYRIGNTVITSPNVFSKGKTTVTATASNGVAPDASCTFTVTVLCGGGPTITTMAVTKPQEIQPEQLSVTARPNPSESYFTLEVKSGDSHPVTVRILDLLGRLVDIRSNVTTNSTLNLGHAYRPGIYYVEVLQGKEKRMLKLVKQAY